MNSDTNSDRLRHVGLTEVMGNSDKGVSLGSVGVSEVT